MLNKIHRLLFISKRPIVRGKLSLAGFTLIEMLVVVAIISILASVVLTGVTGFQASARDTKRIADLNQIKNYLEQYYNRWGHYPGDSSGAVTATTDWASLSSALASFGVRLPNDPISGRTYYYATETAERLRYALGAKLEKDSNALRNPQELDAADISSWTTVPSGMSCDDNFLGYCVGS